MVVATWDRQQRFVPSAIPSERQAATFPQKPAGAHLENVVAFSWEPPRVSFWTPRSVAHKLAQTSDW
jgi:hypothetical protein